MSTDKVQRRDEKEKDDVIQYIALYCSIAQHSKAEQS